MIEDKLDDAVGRAVTVLDQLNAIKTAAGDLFIVRNVGFKLRAPNAHDVVGIIDCFS